MKYNQKGFTLVETLLIVLILAVIGFGGYYVWHSQHPKKVSTSTTSNTSATKYLTITQWGIEGTYSADFTLKYTAPTGSAPAVAYLSSTTCGNGGALERYASTDPWLEPNGNPSGETASQYFNGQTPSNGDFTHLGNYYYLYSWPQVNCGPTQTSQSVQDQTKSAIESVVESLKTIP